MVAHVAVSADGATTGFQPDVTRFYRLAQTWKEDLTLAGADAVLAQEQALAGGDLSGPAPGGPAGRRGRPRPGRPVEALRAAGLVDEVSLLHPCLAGEHATRIW
ncbi:hypothetical protein ACFQ0B_30645 [Nonomuraea thailandensis]